MYWNDFMCLEKLWLCDYANYKKNIEKITTTDDDVEESSPYEGRMVIRNLSKTVRQHLGSTVPSCGNA